jgi:CubicO group peptidase (beta-lactamase class C family)
MLRSVALAVAASLVPHLTAHAQNRAAALDSIFSFATASAPGCAVGVSQRSRVVVDRAYGLANVERRVPLSRTSRFDIGSTQKQFTAAAVLLLVEDGRLSLTDDIRKYLPDLPDYGHTVTVDHLLTHTAGIRDWTGLLPLAPEGTDVLALIHRQRGLDFVPGDEWAYSTSGFELAKEIVAKVSGMSFAEFARRRLFEPLGMKSSAYVPDVLQAGPDAALGYRKDGDGWKEFMRLGNNRGGGAIVSTVGDLVLWTDALATGTLGRFVTAKIHEPARLANGRRLRYARGLMLDSTSAGPLVAHSGGAAGFSTWMGHFTDHDLSVAVACNFDPISATALARRVASLYLPLPFPSGAEAAAAAPGAPGVDVSRGAGLYFDERTGEPMRLVVAGGRLRVANGPPLIALAQDRFRPPRPDPFFRSQADVELSFPTNDQLVLTAKDEPPVRYRRARSWTPSPADLQAVDGRYESTELGSVFEIVPGSGTLTMRFERAPEKSLELTPVERDTWMRSLMIVRFRRDARGEVVGFDYGNPVARHIRFTRLGDRTATSGPAAARPAAPASDRTSGATASTSHTSAAPPLHALTGEYELAPGRTLSVSLENGRLRGQPPGGAKRALSHVSATTFAADGTPITLTFTLGADGRATAVVMRQNGRERTLPRVR